MASGNLVAGRLTATSPDIDAALDSYSKITQRLTDSVRLFQSIKDSVPIYKSIAKGLDELDSGIWETDSGAIAADVEVCVSLSDYPETFQEDNKKVQNDRSKIQKSIEEITLQLKNFLSHEGYPGSFKPIGSSYCGTSCGEATDFDYLYEVYKDNLLLESSGSHYYRLYAGSISGKVELLPSTEYKAFADRLGDYLERVKSGKLTFGGFAHLQYSGVRYCEPAVTVLFRWTSSQGSVYDIPVDITLGYVIPTEESTYRNVELILQRYSIQEIKWLQVRDRKLLLHLVPVSPEQGVWSASTAVLETELQKLLPDSVKKAIKVCKQFKERLECITGDSDPFAIGICQWLESSIKDYRDHRFRCNGCDRYGCLKYVCENNCRSTCEALRETLAFGHIFFDKSVGSKHSESCTKGAVSVNSSAIKYKALELFRDNPNRYKDGEVLLARDILQELFRSSVVRHTFLDNKISIVTVGGHAAYSKDKLYKQFKQKLLEFINQKFNVVRKVTEVRVDHQLV